MSEDTTDKPLTALNLLLEGKPTQALDLLEQLRRDVPMRPGDLIPFERLPIMPLGATLEDFGTAWQAAYQSTDATTQARMEGLADWLRDLHAFEAAPPRFGDRPRDPIPPPRRAAPEQPPAPTVRHRALEWVLRRILQAVSKRVSPFKR